MIHQHTMEELVSFKGKLMRVLAALNHGYIPFASPSKTIFLTSEDQFMFVDAAPSKNAPGTVVVTILHPEHGILNRYITLGESKTQFELLSSESKEEEQ